jgi:hypothetical protein
LSNPNGRSYAITGRQGFVANHDETSQKLVKKRKALWKGNIIQTNRANLPLLDSKAASRKIARDRNGNVNNASAKDKVDNRAVAAKRVAVSNAGDNWLSRINRRREATPAAFYVPVTKAVLSELSADLVKNIS